MKNRNWSKVTLGVVLVAVALALLSFIATARDKRAGASLRVQQGQEIILGDNLKLVVGRIEDGQAEISIYRITEAGQLIPTSEKSDKSDPCSGSDTTKPGRPNSTDRDARGPRTE